LARLGDLTRIAAELNGKGAKRPGLARMICSYVYRFDEDERFARPLSGSLRVADF
jgi:hypothetical protein